MKITVRDYYQEDQNKTKEVEVPNDATVRDALTKNGHDKFFHPLHETLVNGEIRDLDTLLKPGDHVTNQLSKEGMNVLEKDMKERPYVYYQLPESGFIGEI
jgi:hypothetical protein